MCVVLGGRGVCVCRSWGGVVCVFILGGGAWCVCVCFSSWVAWCGVVLGGRGVALFLEGVVCVCVFCFLYSACVCLFRGVV